MATPGNIVVANFRINPVLVVFPVSGSLCENNPLFTALPTAGIIPGFGIGIIFDLFWEGASILLTFFWELGLNVLSKDLTNLSILAVNFASFVSNLSKLLVNSL